MIRFLGLSVCWGETRIWQPIDQFEMGKLQTSTSTRFHIEDCKTKIKVIHQSKPKPKSTTNQNKGKYLGEPMRTQWKKPPTNQSVRKYSWISYDGY